MYNGVDLMYWKRTHTHLIAGIKGAKSQPRNHILHKSGTSENEKEKKKERAIKYMCGLRQNTADQSLLKKLLNPWKTLKHYSIYKR